MTPKRCASGPARRPKRTASGGSRRRSARSRPRPARSLAQIRQEVAELTLLAASKVTGKVLDSADQRRLIDEAISSLDFSVLEEKTPA